MMHEDEADSPEHGGGPNGASSDDTSDRGAAELRRRALLKIGKRLAYAAPVTLAILKNKAAAGY